MHLEISSSTPTWRNSNVNWKLVHISTATYNIHECGTTRISQGEGWNQMFQNSKIIAGIKWIGDH